MADNGWGVVKNERFRVYHISFSLTEGRAHKNSFQNVYLLSITTMCAINGHLSSSGQNVLAMLKNYNLHALEK